MSGHSPTESTSSLVHRGLIDRLGRLSRREAVFGALRGLGQLVGGILPALLALTLVESALYLSPSIKLAATVIFILGLGIGIGWRVLMPLLRPRPPQAIARQIETHFETHSGGLHQAISNAVELGNATRPDGSRALAEAAVFAGAAQAESIDIQAAVPTGPVLSTWRRSGIAVLVCTAVAFFWASDLSSATGRLLTPSVRYDRPALTHLSAEPGNVERISGDELVLGLHIDGLVPTVAQLHIRDRSGDWVSHRLPIKDATVAQRLSLRQSFDYRWSAYDATSATYRVTVHPRPVVAHTRVEYHYPPYTRLADRTDEDGGDVIAPVGTKITLTAKSTRPLSRGWLDFDPQPEDAQQERVQQEGALSDDGVTFDLTVASDQRFTIGLTDTSGIDNANPVSHRILAVPDESPEVAVLRPGADGELGKAMRVALLFEAIDDYGVNQAEIRFRLNDEDQTNVRPVALDSAGAQQLTQGVVWDLSVLDLLPGDYLSYHLRVYDNDAAVGPKSGDSRTYALRFPSLFEIQQDAQRRHDEDIARLEDARQETGEMRQQTEELRRELLKAEDPSWETRAETEAILERQEDVQKRVEETMARVEETQERLEQSGLLSDETIQKLMEVRELMAALDTPELRSAAQELQKAMQKMNAEQIDQAMSRLLEQQEDFQKGLDRAIALLHQVQNDQLVDALTRQLAEMADQQRKIAEQAADTPEMRPLAGPQEAVEREADAFREGADAAIDRLDESAAEALSNLAERFDRASIVPRTGQAARDLQANRVDRARRGTQSLSEDLASLSDQMAGIREERIARQKSDVSRELTGVLQDLLQLSRKQERTSARANQGETNLSAQQARNLAAASQLASRLLEASHKTFLIPRSAAAGLGNALQKMEDTVGHLQRGSGSRASSSAREAMGHLNASALAIKDAIAALQGAGSASGFQEMLQQLRQASNKQGQLNAQTQGAMGSPQRPGGSTPGDLGRMAAEQQAIQQMLDSIRKRLGTQEGSVLGDLGKVSDEMEEVASSLARGDLTRQTVERQRRILSRLLDAQRSARQRGFSREREAQAGGVFAYRGARALPENLGEGVNPLRSRMRDALREGYADRYQPLIRRYFGRLIDQARHGEEDSP